MKNLILLLLLSGSVCAQQSAPSKYNFEDFYLIPGVEAQEKYYNDMVQEMPVEPGKPAMYSEYRAQLAVEWLTKGDFERYNYYMTTAPKLGPLQFLNLTYALEYLEDAGKNFIEIEKISRDIMDGLEKGSISDGIARGQVVMEVNALANARLGNIEAALKSLEKSSAVKEGSRNMNYFRDSKANYYNRYGIIMSAAGDPKRALDTLTRAVRDADSNPKLIATLREVYKKVYGNDKGADKYIASLQSEAYQKYYKEEEKAYIADVNAPVSGEVEFAKGNKLKVFNGEQRAKNVSIPDLNGKMVHLKDYEGKILVIDFWSTGCTPCVAAFAGFERVVADYRKAPFQLFVIDLFEPASMVKSFIAKKRITLDVLHDEPNTAFDVQATPTKIVFDPMGNIRFYSAGYAGSTDREYYKVKAMVEIIKSRASDRAVATFK